MPRDALRHSTRTIICWKWRRSFDRRALMDAEGQEKQPAEEEAWWSQYWHKSFQLSAWELAGGEIKNVVLDAARLPSAR